MKILIIIFALVAGIIFSGCTEKAQVQEIGLLHPDSIQAPVDTLEFVPTDTLEPTPIATTEKTLTKYGKFVAWLKEDATQGIYLRHVLH